jgi:hypothetical protein
MPPQRLAPAERIAAVVHLVEDDQCALLIGEEPMDGCLDRDLRVGDRDPVELPRVRALTVAEARVEPDADAGRGIRPLRLQMLGGATTMMRSTMPRRSSSDARRRANVVLPAPGVAAARKSRGPRSGASGPSAEVGLEGFGLPGAEVLRRSPRARAAGMRATGARPRSCRSALRRRPFVLRHE